jgi:hypothetical protein
LLLAQVSPFGDKQAASSNISIRNGIGGNFRQGLVGLKDLRDLMPDFIFAQAKQDVHAGLRW